MWCFLNFFKQFFCEKRKRKKRSKENRFNGQKIQKRDDVIKGTRVFLFFFVFLFVFSFSVIFRMSIPLIPFAFAFWQPTKRNPFSYVLLKV